MTSDITKPDSSQPVTGSPVYLFDDWFDPIEAQVRERVRGFIQAMIESELDETLKRPRYERPAQSSEWRDRRLDGRRRSPARASDTVADRHLRTGRNRRAAGTPAGGERQNHGMEEQCFAGLSAPHAGRRCGDCRPYLAGTNTRRVRRALKALFGGAVSKDTVSRVWRKVKGDWDTWNGRSLADEPIVRLILDGTVVDVRLDRKATAISLLVVIGVRTDGQKVLLAVKSMGGESTQAWRACSMTSLVVACVALSSSSSMARQAWRRPSPPSGMACRFSDVPCISTATCWRTRPSVCTRRSPPITAM